MFVERKGDAGYLFGDLGEALAGLAQSRQCRTGENFGNG